MHYELVKVLDKAMLLNPVQIGCPYQTRSGRPLPRGIYAVVWSSATGPYRYDAQALYYGPFPSWRLANEFLRSSNVLWGEGQEQRGARASAF